MRNRGITVLLNTITGYDCEYGLNSSLNLTNDLISIQLASTSYCYLKIPFLEKEYFDFNHIDLKLSNHNLRFGEKTMVDICCKSKTNNIKEIRYTLHNEADILITNLTNRLKETDGVLWKLIDDYYLFTYPKSKAETLIKYVNEYSSTELIMDSENIKNYEIGKYLNDFIKLLNEVSGNESVMSDNMKNSVEKCISKPTSRISYKFGKSKHQLIITVNRVLYICMHESTADLSMLKDFDSVHVNISSESVDFWK